MDYLSTIGYRKQAMRVRGGERPARHRRGTLAVGSVLLLIVGCTGRTAVPEGFEISDAKMCAEVNADRKPVRVTSEFPPGTRDVYCWFAWKNARPGLRITSRWYYEAASIHILTLPVSLTRVSDDGVLSLRMPEGKTLPPGSYRLDLSIGKKVLRSVPFTVLEVSAAETPSQAPEAPAQAPAGQ